MSITIQEAIKAMDEGKIVKCISQKDGIYFHRKSKTDKDSYEYSLSSDFEANIDSNLFSKDEIESPWEIIEEEEKIEPCIYCGSSCLSNGNKDYFVECSNEYCVYLSGSADTKEKAIQFHNTIYKKLNPDKMYAINDEINNKQAIDAMTRGFAVKRLDNGLIYRKIDNEYYFKDGSRWNESSELNSGKLCQYRKNQLSLHEDEKWRIVNGY